MLILYQLYITNIVYLILLKFFFRKNTIILFRRDTGINQNYSWKVWRNILHPHWKLTNTSSMLWTAKLLLKLMAYSYIIYQISCLYVHYKTILWPTNIFKVIFRLYRITYATIFCLLINLRTLFSYKIGCSVKLQLYSISFYWRWILTNPPLDYIFFLYPQCLQNF